jgi:hypothetical protein
VIIEAAAGKEYAVLGILATAAMYFQQLPLAALLFEAHSWGVPSARALKARAASRCGLPRTAGGHDAAGSSWGGEALPDQGPGQEPGGVAPPAEGPPALRLRPAPSAQQPTPVHNSTNGGVAGGGGGGRSAPAGAAGEGASFASQFLLRNPVMWATGVAVLLSLCGCHDYLDPRGRHFQPRLGFLEGLLAWFGRCTTPLTLFSAGAWVHGRALGAGERRQVAAYAGLRLLVLPPLMAAIARACGVGRQAGVALVVMASVPIAQVAYLVSEQYAVNTEAVTGVMILGLLALLPHTFLVLLALDRLAVFPPA